MTRTGPVVNLRVAKQAAGYHGLTTLLAQPSPVMTRGGCLLDPRAEPGQTAAVPVCWSAMRVGWVTLVMGCWV